MTQLSAFTAALLLALGGSAGAQVGAMMRGTVVDEEGRPVVHVKVEIQFQGTADLKARTYTQTTNNRGYFARVGLPDGPYKLVFTKDGYDPSTLSTNISLGGLSDLGAVPLRRAAAKPAGAHTGSSAAAGAPSGGGTAGGTAPDAAALAAQQEEVRKAFMQAGEAAKAGKYDQAEILYKDIIGRAPALAAAHASLGYVYRQKKDWSSAEAAYQKAVELQPDESDHYLALAWIQRAQGLTDKALTMLSEPAPRFETNARFVYGSGLLYYDWGKPEEASAAFHKVRALDPSNPEPLYYLGLIAVQKNQPQEGLKHLEQYVAATGQNPQNLATAQGLLKALKK